MERAPVFFIAVILAVSTPDFILGNGRTLGLGLTLFILALGIAAMAIKFFQTLMVGISTSMTTGAHLADCLAWVCVSVGVIAHAYLLEDAVAGRDVGYRANAAIWGLWAVSLALWHRSGLIVQRERDVTGEGKIQ